MHGRTVGVDVDVEQWRHHHINITQNIDAKPQPSLSSTSCIWLLPLISPTNTNSSVILTFMVASRHRSSSLCAISCSKFWRGRGRFASPNFLVSLFVLHQHLPKARRSHGQSRCHIPIPYHSTPTCHYRMVRTITIQIRVPSYPAKYPRYFPPYPGFSRRISSISRHIFHLTAILSFHLPAISFAFSRPPGSRCKDDGR